MSSDNMLARWEPVDDSLTAARIKVFPTPDGERPVIAFGGMRVRASLQEWRDFNEAVELGFTNLTHRPVPQRTDSVKPSGSAA